jgi:raffinose/stachyose/melibiose transport system permease protein
VAQRTKSAAPAVSRRRPTRGLGWGVFAITRLWVYGLALTVIVPMLYLVSVSFTAVSRPAEGQTEPLAARFTLENYQRAFEFAATTLSIPIWRMYANSLIYTGVSIVLAISVAALAAFAFSLYDFRGKEALFLVLLATMTIPLQSLIIPLFLMMKWANLLNSYGSLILPYAAIGVPFATLLLRGYFETLPRDLREAALMDGASDWTYFRRIVVPLSLAPLATCIIFLFLFYWNEFLLSLVLIQSEALQPITLSLSRITQARATQPVAVHAAIILVTVLPIFIVFAVFQRWFVRGIAAGAIKG